MLCNSREIYVKSKVRTMARSSVEGSGVCSCILTKFHQQVWGLVISILLICHTS